jgi:HEPN domain-containing protein
MPLTRLKFRRLARTRIQEARTLLQDGRYSGAYYLTGLAMECALKACIAAATRKNDFPDREIVNASYTHNLAKLVRLAGLEDDLNRAMGADLRFSISWGIVKDWDVQSRYAEISATVARDIYNAAASRQHGAMSWIRKHW